jgi:hypothetical protein
VRIDKQSHPREYVAHLGPFQERWLSEHPSNAFAGIPPRGLGRGRDPGNGHNLRIRASGAYGGLTRATRMNCSPSWRLGEATLSGWT